MKLIESEEFLAEVVRQIPYEHYCVVRDILARQRDVYPPPEAEQREMEI